MEDYNFEKRLQSLNEEELHHANLMANADLLRQYSEEDRIIRIKEAVEEERKTKKDFTFQSGFEEFDEILQIKEGDLLVLSGPTGMGKTTFAKSITFNLTSQDIKCLWFSYEVNLEQLVRGFDAEIPEFYVPAKMKTEGLDWVEMRIKEGIAKYGTKVVFIDHLHYLLQMRDMAVAKNLSLLIGDTLRRLKSIAVQNDITIFLISHMKKLLYDKEPDIEDLRDSSFVGQEADAVIFVRRAKDNGEYTDESVIKVAKNRRTGKQGKFILYHDDGLLKEPLSDDIWNIKI